MYRDYGGFGKDYWHGEEVPDTHPAGFSWYDEDSFPFRQYADVVHHYADPDDSIVVVGCAFGYTVAELRSRGLTALGLDYSTYAVENAVTDHVMKGDVRRFVPNADIVFDSSVLTSLTDHEAMEACENMREAARDRVIHKVWSTDGSRINEEHYNAKLLEDWIALCDPDEQDIWLTEFDFHAK